MKFYWSINKIPEIAGLSSEHKKQTVLFCMKKNIFKLWQSYLCFFVLIFLAMVIKVNFKFTGSIADGITGGGIGFIFWLVMINVLRPQFQNHVRKNFPNE